MLKLNNKEYIVTAMNITKPKIIILSSLVAITTVGGVYLSTGNKPLTTASKPSNSIVITTDTAQPNPAIDQPSNPTIQPTSQTEPNTSPTIVQNTPTATTPAPAIQTQPSPTPVVAAPTPATPPAPTIVGHVEDTVLNTELQRVDHFCTTTWSDGTSNRVLMGALPIDNKYNITFDC